MAGKPRVPLSAKSGPQKKTDSHEKMLLARNRTREGNGRKQKVAGRGNAGKYLHSAWPSKSKDFHAPLPPPPAERPVGHPINCSPQDFFFGTRKRAVAFVYRNAEPQDSSNTYTCPCVLAGDGSTIPSEQATCFPGCGEKFRGSPPVARIKGMFHRVFTRALR